MQIADLAAVVSAGVAVLSAAFSIYMYSSNRKFQKPFQRPVLSLEHTDVGLDNKGEIGYQLTIANTGRLPATRIQIRARAAPADTPSQQIEILNREFANDYVPGAQIYLSILPKPQFTSDTLMQVILSYADRFSGKEYNDQSYWLAISPGPGGTVSGMTREQRERAESAWASFPS